MLSIINPTDEKVRESFLSDMLDRKKYVLHMCELLKTAEDATVIALDGRWGEGKTFFVKQVKLVLDCFAYDSQIEDKDSIVNSIGSKNDIQSYTDNPMVSVYYDAWRNDSDTDPVLSIIYGIISELGLKTKLESSLKMKNVVEQIIKLLDKRNILGVIKAMQPDDYLECIERKKDLENAVRAFLEELPKERGNRINIFIDELDRCNPSYAVLLLERVKHYFECEQVTFVFSVNLHSLEKTIKHYYGANTEGTRYLDRFFDVRMMLPPVPESLLYRALDFGDTAFDAGICLALVKQFEMSLRESLRFAKHYKKAISLKSGNGGYRFWARYFLPIALAFFLTDMEKYQSFMLGSGEEYLSLLVENENIRDNLLRQFNRGQNTIIPEPEKHLRGILVKIYKAIHSQDYYLSNDHLVEEVGFDIDENTRELAFRSVGMFV